MLTFMKLSSVISLLIFTRLRKKSNFVSWSDGRDSNKSALCSADDSVLYTGHCAVMGGQFSYVRIYSHYCFVLKMSEVSFKLSVSFVIRKFCILKTYSFPSHLLQLDIYRTLKHNLNMIIYLSLTLYSKPNSSLKFSANINQHFRHCNSCSFLEN